MYNPSYVICTLFMCSLYPYPTLDLPNLSIADFVFLESSPSEARTLVLLLAVGWTGSSTHGLGAGTWGQMANSMMVWSPWLFFPNTNFLPKCCPFELRSNGRFTRFNQVFSLVWSINLVKTRLVCFPPFALSLDYLGSSTILPSYILVDSPY